MMPAMDDRQASFAEFEVPDPGRIIKVRDWLERHGHLERGSVLEIGYARGGLLDRAGDRVRKVAVDVHPREAPPDVTFHRHDCNEPFDFAEDASFDVVFGGEVIEHIHDDRRFLQEIHRVLAPGGALALTTPNLFFLVNRIVMPFGKMPYFAYEPYHYHFYSRATLSGLVRECGFDVRRVTSSHVLVSSRRNRLLGSLCERLGDAFPTFGAHLILFATRGSAPPADR